MDRPMRDPDNHDAVDPVDGRHGLVSHQPCSRERRIDCRRVGHASATVTVLQVQPTTKTTSPNWAGYVATGGPYTDASGSWTVPTANCANAVGTDSATWVGIDGSNNSTVEQIGTDSNCVFTPRRPVVLGLVPDVSKWSSRYRRRSGQLPGLRG